MLTPAWVETVSCCCAGGTSLFPSLRERVEREVGELAAQNAKVKVTSPANTMERRFSVWLGASFHTLTLFLVGAQAHEQ